MIEISSKAMEILFLRRLINETGRMRMNVLSECKSSRDLSHVGINYKLFDTQSFMITNSFILWKINCEIVFVYIPDAIR